MRFLVTNGTRLVSAMSNLDRVHLHHKMNPRGRSRYSTFRLLGLDWGRLRAYSGIGRNQPGRPAGLTHPGRAWGCRGCRGASSKARPGTVRRPVRCSAWNLEERQLKTRRSTAISSYNPPLSARSSALSLRFRTAHHTFALHSFFLRHTPLKSHGSRTPIHYPDLKLGGKK